MLMSAAIRPVPLKPDVSELLSRARAIAEIVRARAQATETNRRIADDVIERMREAELFRILQPNAYGGFEYGFDVFAELVAAIRRALSLVSRAGLTRYDRSSLALGRAL